MEFFIGSLNSSCLIIQLKESYTENQGKFDYNSSFCFSIRDNKLILEVYPSTDKNGNIHNYKDQGKLKGIHPILVGEYNLSQIKRESSYFYIDFSNKGIRYSLAGIGAIILVYWAYNKYFDNKKDDQKKSNTRW